MANTLTGVIKITAPGAKEAFDMISLAVKEQEIVLKNLRGEFKQLSDLQARGVKSDKITAELAATSKKIDETKNNIADLNSQLKEFTPGKLDELPKVLNKTGVSSSSASSALLQLSSKLGILSPVTATVTRSFGSLFNAFERAKAAAATGTSVFTILKNTIGQITFNPLVLGAGLLVGALAGLLSKVKPVAVDFSYLAEQLKITQEAQKELEKGISGAAAAVLSEAKNLSELRDILISTTSASNQLTDSVIKRGLAQFLFNEKNIELQKILSAEIEREFLLRKRLTGGIGGVTEFKVDPQLESLKKLRATYERLGTSDPALNRTIKRIEELNNIIGNSGGQVGVLNNLAKGFDNLFKSFLDGKGKEVKVPKLKLKVDKLEIQAGELGDIPSPNPIRFSKDRTTEDDILIVSPRELTEMEKAAEAYADALQSAFDVALSEIEIGALTALGEALGDALTGSGVGSAIANFERVLGSALKSLGVKIIALGVAGKALKKATAFFIANPALAVIAGVGLVALGTALTNLASKGIQARALGGPVGAGGTYLVGERGPELFTPNTGGQIIPNNQLGGRGAFMAGQSGGMHQVVFEIAGTKLKGVLALTDQSLNRLV